MAHLDFTAIDMNDVTAADLEKWEEAFNRFFSRYTKAELHREAIKRDIMLYPVNTIADLFNDDQLQARDFWQTVPHPHLEADIVFPGAPFKSNVTATRISGPAPGVGEHNDAVFGDLLGLAPDKLGELAAQGVI